MTTHAVGAPIMPSIFHRKIAHANVSREVHCSNGLGNLAACCDQDPGNKMLPKAPCGLEGHICRSNDRCYLLNNWASACIVCSTCASLAGLDIHHINIGTR